MNEPWFILTKRLGSDVITPSPSVLDAAMREVVDPSHAGDIEHTSAFVRFGYDEGSMYVLSYDTSLRLTFEQWADQDFEVELAPTAYLSNVSPSNAARLMQELSAGAVDRVKQEPWTPVE